MDRREIVLAAFAAGGENARFSPVQVQKLLFLMDREASEFVGGPHFDFVPYDYGPFDRAVYDVLGELSTEGLVETRNSGRYREYSLTPEGYESGRASLEELPDKARSFLLRLTEWVMNLSFRQLVAAIYRRYPEMKANSIFRR